MDQRKLDELAAKAEKAKLERAQQKREGLEGTKLNEAPYASVEFDRAASGRGPQQPQGEQAQDSANVEAGRGSQMVKNSAPQHNLNPPSPMRAQPDREAYYAKLSEEIRQANQDRGSVKDGQEHDHDQG